MKKMPQTIFAFILLLGGSLVPYLISLSVGTENAIAFILVYFLWLLLAVLLGIALGHWRALLLTPIPYLLLLLTTIVRGNMGEVGIATLVFGILAIAVWFIGIVIGVLVRQRRGLSL